MPGPYSAPGTPFSIAFRRRCSSGAQYTQAHYSDHDNHDQGAQDVGQVLRIGQRSAGGCCLCGGGHGEGAHQNGNAVAARRVIGDGTFNKRLQRLHQLGLRLRGIGGRVGQVRRADNDRRR